MWKILVVDDDINMREMIVSVLMTNDNYEVAEAKDAVDAIEILKKRDFDLIISDFKMPHINGLEFLKWVKKYKKNPCPFLLMTAYGEISNAVEAMRLGAADYIEKNPQALANVDFIDIIVKKILTTINELKLLKDENNQLKDIIERKSIYIGETDCIKKIEEEINTVAASKASILITGESGTGKELIAKNIHYKSQRHTRPFIKINCAAIPETLIESELFGYEKGAFTGAEKTTKGKFELADSGTLLLDEIGEMPINMQSKLLRVLQEREITRIGGTKAIPIDVRVIATTNRDLVDEINNANFREDLYFRLNVINIHLPPLRERKEDIPILVDHFISLFNNENGFSVSGIDKEAIDCIVNYNWPGNIRELQNVTERAVIFKKTGKIQPIDIAINPNTGRLKPKDNNDLNIQENEFSFLCSAGMSIEDAEKKLITKTLLFCNNNKNKAAEMLKVTVRTLRNKLNLYNNNSIT